MSQTESKINYFHKLILYKTLIKGEKVQSGFILNFLCPIELYGNVNFINLLYRNKHTHTHLYFEKTKQSQFLQF